MRRHADSIVTVECEVLRAGLQRPHIGNAVVEAVAVIWVGKQPIWLWAGEPITILSGTPIFAASVLWPVADFKYRVEMENRGAIFEIGYAVAAVIESAAVVGIREEISFHRAIGAIIIGQRD